MVPLRGEVWDAHVPGAGNHPVVVLTINALIGRLSSVTVAVVTGNEGPRSTHIPLGPETDLTKYDVSYANVTDIHTLAQTKLSRRRGSLHPGELVRIEDALRVTLGL